MGDAMEFIGFTDRGKGGPVAEFDEIFKTIPRQPNPVFNKKSLICRRDNLKNAGFDVTEEQKALDAWPEGK